MKHKLLSILLSLSLVISLLPTVALAAEGTTEVKFTPQGGSEVAYMKAEDANGNITLYFDSEKEATNYATASYELNGKIVTFKGATLRSVNNLMRAYWEVCKNTTGCDYNPDMLPANESGTLTWTIYGKVEQGEYLNSGALILPALSGGYIYNSSGYQWKKIAVNAGTENATIVSNSNFSDDYGYISAGKESTTITGIKIDGSTYAKPANGSNLIFENCTIAGMIRTPNGNGKLKVTDCTFVGDTDTENSNKKNEYVIFSQAGGELEFTNNTVSSDVYTRGLNVGGSTNLETKINGNNIGAVSAGYSAIQLSGSVTKAQITSNQIAVNGGNAFTLHSSLAAGSEVGVSNNTITGTGYLFYDETDTTEVDITYTGNDVPDTINTTEGIKGTDVKENSSSVSVAVHPVATINGKGYATPAAAVAAANDGDTITLVKAVELTSTLSITADKKITLDLNGCKISADMNGPHMICNAGNLTITDSSAAKTGEIAKVGDASNYGYVIENHGTMLLDSCKITSTSSVSSAIENGWYTPAQNTSGTNCTMTIQNAEVTSVNAAGGLYTVKNDDYGVMVINGGIFTNGTEGAGAVLNWNNLTIHNGTFTGTSAVRTLKSGTNDYETGKTYIYDGTFNGKIDTLAGYGENIDVNISGGSFSQPVKEEYCADGFIPKDNGNGTYGVKTGTYAAKIGDTKYESLEVAVSNVTADETITLLQDVPAESVITVARTISFKVDTNKSDGSGVYAFAADTNIIKGNNTTLTTAVESNVYTYSFVYTAPSSSGSSGYYVSTPSKTEHGTVTVSPRYADKGDTVTVTVKPDSGYVLGSLTVTDSKGNELTLTDKGNGKYTFVMPAGKVEVKASFAKEIETSPFADVATDAYYYEAVKWAVGKGITTGVGNDLFAPEQPCTRAQIVTFLWRAAGAPEPKGTAASLTDVVSGSYYEKAVAWAIENGITTGTGDGEFSPDDTCTRAQAVTFLARALNAKAASAAEFSDVPTDSYFADAVAWAAANGVTEGVGNGMFAPDNDCTRGQIVTFLFRAYNK